MSKKKKFVPEACWLDEPAENNYPAALSYLTLLYEEDAAKDLVDALRKARTVEFKSKDIFRASQLPLLGISNTQIKKNNHAIKHRKDLSPILLVRDKARGKVIVADGYHRLCAVYHFHEEAMIPCRVVSSLCH